MSRASSSRDVEAYRAGYPGWKDRPDLDCNVRFYRNQLPSKPSGDTIDAIHSTWWGNYERLERHHGYIQWLFPIRESGLNIYAQPLQLHEVKTLMGDPECMARIYRSYEMMLDFFGMTLADRSSGRLERGANWASRYANLEESRHNFLRITRILKFLGEMGLVRLQVGFVEHILHEMAENHVLLSLQRSAHVYWIQVIKDDKLRMNLQGRYMYFFSQPPPRIPGAGNRRRMGLRPSSSSSRSRHGGDLEYSELQSPRAAVRTLLVPSSRQTRIHDYFCAPSRSRSRAACGPLHLDLELPFSPFERTQEPTSSLADDELD